MAEMNKKKVSRVSELEKELIGDEAQKQSIIETGKDRVYTAPESRMYQQRNRLFQIKQGTRMRHPRKTLRDMQGVVEGTENAEQEMERAYMHNQQRQDIPQEYIPKDGGMLANQVGLVTTALDNAARSKAKMSRLLPVGV